MKQLNLFRSQEALQFPEDLLEYYPGFVSPEESAEYMQKWIGGVSWRQQAMQMYGKKVLAPRLMAWFGDTDKSYTFSGTRFEPYAWTTELANLKRRIEEKTDFTFNSVLLNYYRDGNDSVAWHGDNEYELGRNPVIASVSLGQERRFEFRYRPDNSRKYGLTLENGSLLIMKGDLQHTWEHRVPKSKTLNGPRINLTFRTIRK
ncbi:alpha-ketoglutarate-dependent dioxygenase AlkB [Dyadobacter sp. CY261]|uniref:alpha-ketoglutarate-dependent dioxygenase AlkB family protein n=1 Tax=Dyadobacter sp. CY261 TaxID=2907203 RepID=UPI001F46946B|nr:alpha-ketoglutarate-dependent dioxygenase AlkB [Dyadobacter sp. CY261]MCF0069816.1 alpha-ketoglutarate-dependent dioxygenase AlkB [Dyadobacter sp. CY261]